MTYSNRKKTYGKKSFTRFGLLNIYICINLWRNETKSVSSYINKTFTHCFSSYSAVFIANQGIELFKGVKEFPVFRLVKEPPLKLRVTDQSSNSSLPDQPHHLDPKPLGQKSK